ncbi:MAG: type II toxin-antitoxin system RelE/ParE family toxin [Dysgonamonadaceae bacterium]|jgi:plasmid stabilization system protein ParE|nr:type II toxin-antitoxin system RelE/ParE family toxin [Dysgonamonadaceae bacterium]
MEIIWLPLAEKALEDIFAFYEEKSVHVARKVVFDILQATGQLADFPEMAAVEQFL